MDAKIAHANLPAYTRSGINQASGGLGPIGPPHLGLPDLFGFTPYIYPGVGNIGFGGFEGWGATFDPVLKKVLAGVLSSVGYGDYESGVFDRPQSSVPVVLDPEVLVRTPTIPDELPEFVGIYGPRPPTDWDAVYAEYEVLNPPEEEMAHDWGHLIRQGVESIAGLGVPQVQQLQFGPTTGGTIVGPASTLQTATLPGGSMNALCPPAGSCAGPRYLTYDCRTGTMSVRRRRRRRALLTEGDKRDLGVIVAMFGKGAAAQIALAAAVKR